MTASSLEVSVLVLVVDAVAADTAVLSKLLADSGYRVRVAQTGPEAITAIHQERPQLLLVADELAEIKGSELRAALTIDKRTSDIPTLMLRPRGDPACAPVAQDAPSADFIWKPFDRHEVLARVATQVELGRLRAKHTEQARLLTLAMQRLSAAVSLDDQRARQLDDSKGRLQTLLDNLPGLAYRCRNDADWTMEFLSDGCLTLTGYRPDDLLLNKVVSYATLIREEDGPLVREAVEAGLTGKAPYEMEYRIRHKDGTERWVWERGRGIFDRRGEVVCLDGLIVDITDRKRDREQLARQMQRLESTVFETVRAVANMTELRDPYTAGHERSVAVVARAIGVELGLPRDRCQGLEVIGLLHDIGKVAVPTQILSKPSALTDLEYEMVKTHAQAGFNILQGLDFPWPVAETILQHHERLDGSGYPRGLQGGDISLEARIIAVADVVAAMSAHRPYRPALGVAAALEELTVHGRAKYDQDIARACVRLFQEKGLRLPR